MKKQKSFFPPRLLTPNRRKVVQERKSINDILLTNKSKAFSQQQSNPSRYLISLSSQTTLQSTKIIPKDQWIFDEIDNLNPIQNKDVYYHTKPKSQIIKQFSTIPTHISTQQSLYRTTTLPTKRKPDSALTISSNQPKLQNKSKAESVPKERYQTQPRKQMTKTYSYIQVQNFNEPLPIMKNDQDEDYIIKLKDGEFFQENLQNKKPIIDVNELKKLYEEIDQLNNKIEKAAIDSDQFVAKLYSGKEQFLHVTGNVLTDQELKYLQEQLRLKQELITNQQTFESINFDQIDDIVYKLQFFERFTKSTRINLIKLGVYMEVPPGEYVFHQGDFGDNLFVILSGSVVVKVDKQFQRDGPIIEQVVSSLYDGQHFGELAMMETQQKQDEVVLEEKLENINITRLEEAQKELFRLDMEELEKESKMLKNMKIMELKKKNSSMLEWMQQDPKERHFIMQLVNEDKDHQLDGQIRPSTIQYKKINKNMQRKASIQASETCHLLAISRENFKNILMVLMQDELEQKIKMLKTLRFLNHIQPFVLIPLANQLIAQRFQLDEVVVREGEELQFMYIIYKGSCNVIRTTTTSRIKLPSDYKTNRKSFEFLQKHQPRNISIESSDYLKSLAANGDITYKIPDYAVEQNTNCNIIYKKSYIYKSLYPGEVLFGRVLTGLTLEGKKGIDKARMTIVSTSNCTILYKISQQLLQFCPEFLIQHLINQLIIQNEIDQIPKSELNAEIKKIYSETRKLTYDEEIIQQEHQKKKQIEKEYLQRTKLKKTQNEQKQDKRNEEWELFKQNTVIDQIQFNHQIN